MLLPSWRQPAARERDTDREMSTASFGQTDYLWQCVGKASRGQGLSFVGAWSAYHLPPELGGARGAFAASQTPWKLELRSTHRGGWGGSEYDADDRLLACGAV